jgi:hypothetical protein
VVDVYVGYLRKKLEQPFGRPLIRTVRGVGYVLDPADADGRHADGQQEVTSGQAAAGARETRRR